MTVRQILRSATAAVAIAVISPIGFAALDLAPAAMAGAKGNGNDHADGKGGGKSDNSGKANGNTGQGTANGKQSAGETSDLNKGQAKKAEMMAAKATRLSVEEDPSMEPDALGKLNGVLNASTNALMNASPSSPIGMAGTTLKEALAAAEALNSDLDPTNDVTPEELADQLAGIFDGMTNKTLTGSQVLAVMDRVAELDPTLSRYDLDVQQDPLVAEENAVLADNVASEVNSFGLAEAIADFFDDDESQGEESE